MHLPVRDGQEAGGQERAKSGRVKELGVGCWELGVGSWGVGSESVTKK